MAQKEIEEAMSAGCMPYPSHRLESEEDRHLLRVIRPLAMTSHYVRSRLDEGTLKYWHEIVLQAFQSVLGRNRGRRLSAYFFENEILSESFFATAKNGEVLFRSRRNSLAFRLAWPRSGLYTAFQSRRVDFSFSFSLSSYLATAGSTANPSAVNASARRMHASHTEHGLPFGPGS